MSGTDPRRGLPLVGLAAAACVACCAVPLWALIGGAGVVAAIGTWAAGALAGAILIAGFAVTLLAMSWRRRRRRTTGLIQIQRHVSSADDPR